MDKKIFSKFTLIFFIWPYDQASGIKFWNFFLISHPFWVPETGYQMEGLEYNPNFRLKSFMM